MRSTLRPCPSQTPEPTPLNRSERWGAVLICVSFVVISAGCALGMYQGQGGDFAQYALHARNVLLGREWSFLLEGYPAVLPLYPLLLAGIFSVSGDNFYLVAISNSCFWSASTFGAYLICRDMFGNRSTALLGLLIITHSAPLRSPSSRRLSPI